MSQVTTIALEGDDVANGSIEVSHRKGEVRIALKYDPEGEVFETVLTPEATLELVKGLSTTAYRAMKQRDFPRGG